MENLDADEIISYFTYDDLLHICNKLNKEWSKLKHFVSTYKTIISPFKEENKNSLEEIVILKKK